MVHRGAYNEVIERLIIYMVWSLIGFTAKEKTPKCSDHRLFWTVQNMAHIYLVRADVDRNLWAAAPH